MAKAYLISVYRVIKDPARHAVYAKLALSAIEAGGGRILARGMAVKAYEAGQLERTVIIEFDSVAQAAQMHGGLAYRAALEVLGDSAVRDTRIVYGVEPASVDIIRNQIATS